MDCQHGLMKFQLHQTKLAVHILSNMVGAITDEDDKQMVYKGLNKPNTTIHKKWLPAETLCMILLPAKRFSKEQDHMYSLGRKPFITHNSICRKQEIADSLGGSQI